MVFFSQGLAKTIKKDHLEIFLLNVLNIHLKEKECLCCHKGDLLPPNRDS